MRNIFRLLGFLFFCGLILGSSAFAQGEPPSEGSSNKIIKAVGVTGNKAISTETIMAKIKSRVGQPYYPQAGREDIKRLYETGFFSDISLDLEEQEGGLKVVFKVIERPIVSEIRIEGAKIIAQRTFLLKMKTKKGQYLSLAILKEDIATIKKEYEKRGMPEVAVAQNIATDPATNKTIVTLTVTEGERVRIRAMYIDGNLAFSDGKIFSLIKTRKQRGIFHAGFYKEDQFNEDVDRIKSFYLKNGYLDVKVDYRIDFDAERRMYLRIIVDEGKQYTVGGVTIRGAEKFSEEEVTRSLKACLEGMVFNYDALKEDVSNIQSFYYGKGYIFVQVKDTTSLDAATGKVSIAYAITENQVAYVDRVDIRGNIKTQDKVIRRELRIKPGERFDGDKLKRTKERLYNLGYFEEINYDTEPATEPDHRNLVVDVKEAKTGSFSFGGGYSSVDQLVGFAEVEQKNFDWRNWKTFTGAGEDLKLRGELGSVRQTYELSFTKPWFLDYPVSAGFDVYRRQHDRESNVGYSYAERRTGGDVRLGKDFSEYLKGGMTMRMEEIFIHDVDPLASSALKEEEGKNHLNSMEFMLTHDTTDNVFNPSRGLVISVSDEVAGGPFGGDKNFNKVFTLASQYVPVYAGTVLQFQGRAGFETPYGSSGDVPIYERFFAGGANTIRGYEERSVGPSDPLTEDPLGGESLLVGNIEYTVPLVEFVKGALFMDTGNVWSKAKDFASGGFKTSVGFGLRIKTPIGPLKLDLGFPLNKQEGQDKRARFHFSMGREF